MNFFDSAIYNFLSSLQNPVFTMFMRVMSSLVSVTVIITALLCIFLLFKNKKIFLYFTSLTFIAKFLNMILKGIFKRPRPSVARLSFETGYSFPSAHAMVATVFYGFIIYLIIKNMKNKKLKKFLIVLHTLIIAFIGISRIYLGVHYATDVIFGTLFGVITVFLFIKFIYKNDWLESEKVEEKNDKNKTASSKKATKTISGKKVRRK